MKVLEEKVAELQEKVDVAGRGIVEMMGIVRALGVKSKVLQQEESGRLVIVAPSPKKRKRK